MLSFWMQDPTLATESWDRFLPKFKAKNAKSKKPNAAQLAKQKAKKITPFPPANHQMPSKVRPACCLFVLTHHQHSVPNNASVYHYL